MNLCKTLICKFFDTIITNRALFNRNEIATYLLDTVFQNDLLNDDNFNDYIGKIIVQLHSDEPFIFFKYMKKYNNMFEKDGKKLQYADEFKLDIGLKLRSLHYFSKYLTTGNEKYFPSHFRRDILFVAKFILQINDVLNFSDDELKELNDLVIIFETKTYDYNGIILNNKELIINCIEKYLYHIVKIPLRNTELKKAQEEYQIIIKDKWNKSDDALKQLLGFTPFEYKIRELFSDDSFIEYCLNSGAVIISGGYPCCDIGISCSIDEFVAKLKDKYNDIDKFLPYMKITPGVTITGHED